VYPSSIDLVNEIMKLFGIQKKLIEIPHFISVITIVKDWHLLLFTGVLAACQLLINGKGVMKNDQQFSLISLILEYSEFLMRKSVVRRTISLGLLCIGIFNAVLVGAKMPGDYPDLMKSLLEQSGWTEWLICIFNILNPLFPPSSPWSYLERLPPSLSFLSSEPPSKYTAKIVEKVSEIVLIVRGSSAPKEIIDYYELTSFSE
jgi:hypothetical protein